MKTVEINNIYDIIVEFIIEELKKENKITDKTKIIYPGLGNDLLSVGRYFKNNNIDSIIIAFSDTDSLILNELYSLGLDLITIPNYGVEALIDMANDMKLEIKDSYVLNLFKEKKGVSAIYKNYAKEFYNANSDMKVLHVPLVFGVLTGLAKYVKNKDEDIKIIGHKRFDYNLDILDEDYFDEIDDNYNSSIIIEN